MLLVTLTTPVPRDQDVVFPGENWFFYWKTAASLWKAKLSDFPGNKIVVPLNWSFHTETGDQFDFDDIKPETNLKRLVEICREVGKGIVFFLPLGPAPFLQNGGLPHFLARGQAKDPDQIAYGVIDAEDNLVKIYSFFDPRVFQAFDRFTKRLGQYFSTNQVSADIWGIRSGFFRKGEFHYFLEDSSHLFQQSFLRFVKTRHENPADLTALELKEQKFLFQKSIQELYEVNAKESFPHQLEGFLDVAFIGASTENFIKRLTHTLTSYDLSEDLYESLVRDIVPSSVLLSPNQKNGILIRELNDLVANSYLPSRLEGKKFEEEGGVSFRPLSFFKVYQKIDGLSDVFQKWSDFYFWDYLKNEFGWCFKIVSSSHFKLQFIEGNQENNVEGNNQNIHLFHGHDVDREVFHFILKTFLNGGRVVLNRSGLSEEYSQRFEAFILENNLDIEEVHFKTQLKNISLGEARLTFFDGDQFQALSKEEFLEFWKTLIKTFAPIYIPLQNADGVHSYWRTRPSMANELKFEEVRRLSLYNPTSYRKRIKMNLIKNFVVYKVIDEINVIVQTYPNEIEVELSPGGSVTLDFGVFS